MPQTISRIRRRFADEQGIALALALSALLVLTILGTSVFSYTTSNTHAAGQNQGRTEAWAVAEAGVGAAFSILANPANDANKALTLPPGACAAGVACYPCGGTLCFETPVRGGYALWSGSLQQPIDAMPYWVVTSTGYVRNPYSSTSTTETAIVKIPVSWSLSQPVNNPAWSQIMSTHPPSAEGTCDETIEQGVVIASPLFVEGNLCLQNSAAVQQGPLNVKGSLWLQQPNSIVGTKTGSGAGAPVSPISDIHVGGRCQYQSNGFHTCGSLPGGWHADNIYATTYYNYADPSVGPPVIDWNGWYTNASPGPYAPCTLVSSGPVPVFENEAPLPNPPSGALRNNSVPTPFNLTPAASYTCKTDAGELSWNAGTHALTIRGAIFIDGSAYVGGGTGNFVATYSGQGALYLSGDFFMKNAVLCTAIKTTGSQPDCDMSKWDPNHDLLAVLANGSGGQPGTNMNPLDGDQFVSSTFQGAVYATANIDTDTSSRVYGPMLANQVNLGQSVKTVFPAIKVSGFWLNTGNSVYAQVGQPVYLNG